MDEASAQALVALNRRFYDQHARSFDKSRQQPWPGWLRLLDYLPTRAPRVLDAGCGNGRLAHFLLQQQVEPLSYLGVDPCVALLQSARRSLGHRLRRLRLVAANLAPSPRSPWPLRREGDFHLVAAMALLHHLPSRERRQRLLVELAAVLEPGGLLAVSLWQIERNRRLMNRRLRAEDSEAPVAGPVHERAAGSSTRTKLQLEQGDVFLPWQGQRHTPRYCHQVDRAEEQGLIESVPWPLVSRYEADGREGNHNRYLLFRRPR